MTVSDKVDVRLALDADLMHQARSLNLDLSKLLEASVRRALTAAGGPAGRLVSSDAESEAFDRYIEENGPFYRAAERQ